MILHIMIVEKFLAPFIDFVDSNFGRGEHKYVFITSEKYHYGLTPEHNVEFLHTDDGIFITLLKYMKEASKIILHGLWRDKVDLLLVQNPGLFKKCYWIMWGGDFYYPDKQSDIRKKVIKRMGYIVNYTDGDYELAKKWYGAKGNRIKCFCYTSNLYKSLEVSQHKENSVNILVGNSADPSNNHIDIFDKLEKFKDQEINIYAPLSYGDQVYAKKIIEEGKLCFGQKFKPLTEFLPFDKYLELLGKIDIAIFNHSRQQAMGNIRTLIGLGKKVYMRDDVTTFDSLKNDGIKVFNLNEIELEPEFDEKFDNQKKIKSIFSEQNLIACLSDVFGFQGRIR